MSNKLQTQAEHWLKMIFSDSVARTYTPILLEFLQKIDAEARDEVHEEYYLWAREEIAKNKENCK